MLQRSAARAASRKGTGTAKEPHEWRNRAKKEKKERRRSARAQLGPQGDAQVTALKHEFAELQSEISAARQVGEQKLRTGYHSDGGHQSSASSSQHPSRGYHSDSQWTGHGGQWSWNS